MATYMFDLGFDCNDMTDTLQIGFVQFTPNPEPGVQIVKKGDTIAFNLFNLTIGAQTSDNYTIVTGNMISPDPTPPLPPGAVPSLISFGSTTPFAAKQLWISQPMKQPPGPSAIFTTQNQYPVWLVMGSQTVVNSGTFVMEATICVVIWRTNTVRTFIGRHEGIIVA